MVEITPRAEELLLELRAARGNDQTDGVRFEAEAGKVRLRFMSAAKPRDRVLEGARLPIFVAPELADTFLDGARIDAAVSDGKRLLVVSSTRPEGSPVSKF